MISTIHTWLKTLDTGYDVATVFFDFKKAYDTVPHSLLIDKLIQLQLHPCIIDLIFSYLTERSQSVVVNGATSQPVIIKSGVPQGSVLGPLLFLIYINNISGLSFSSECQLVLYADDLVLFKVIRTSADFLDFQNDINKVVHWVDINLLTLNSSKCKRMLLTRKTTAMPPLFLHNGTEMIQEVKTYKYLGIYISADLRWDVHINNICLKCKKLLGLLYRRCANSAFLYRLYLSLVRPILDYACQVWDPFTKKNIDQLESVQKFALKICAHCWDINYLELLDMFNISNPETRRIYLRLTTFHKVVNGSFPTHSYNTHLFVQPDRVQFLQNPLCKNTLLPVFFYSQYYTLME